MTRSLAAIDATLTLLGLLPPTAFCRNRETLDELDQPAIDVVSWHRLIAFASSHFVLQALAEPLKSENWSGQVPKDVQNFMDAVHEANSVRNGELRTSLINITEALNECGVTPVALKGATFLLGDPVSNASWRFMSDIDLLVPEDRLPDCVAATKKLGFTQTADTYDPSIEAHFPPLISPCGTFSVELHTRLFGLDDFDLPSGSVWAEARLSRQITAKILIPSMLHRLAHLLAHAQLHNRNFATRRIVLKDFQDLIMLERESGLSINWGALLGLFKTPERRRAIEALLAAWRMCSPGSDMLDIPPHSEVWAKGAIRRLYRPRWLNCLSVPGDMLSLETHRLQTERGHLNRRLRLLSDPIRLFLTSVRWAGKLQQRLWG